MANNNRKSTRKPAMQICSSKHEPDIFAFCVTDSCYVCEKCFEKDHRTHTIEYLKFLTRDHLRVAQTLEATVAQTIYACDQQLQTYSRKKLSEKLTHSVTEYIEDFTKALQQSCVSIIQNLHETVSEDLTNLDHTQKTVGQLKDQLIVLLGNIKQQVRVYEKEIRNSRYKWFHEHYARLCEYEDQANQLRQAVATGTQALSNSFPELSLKLGMKEMVQMVAQNLRVQKKTRKSEEPPGKKSLFRTSTAPQRKKAVTPDRPAAGIEEYSAMTSSAATERKGKMRRNAAGSRSATSINKPPSTGKSTVRSQQQSYYSKSSKSSVLLPQKAPHEDAATPPSPPCIQLDLSRNRASAKGSSRGSVSPARSRSPTPNKRKPAAASLNFIDSAAKTLFTLQVPGKQLSQLKLAYKKPLPDGYAAITARGKLFLTGGELGKTIISDALEIDLKTAFAKPKSPMLMHRRNHGLLCIRNHAYALGGYNKSNNILSKCEKYNFATDSWNAIPSLNKERNFVTCCVFSERFLYVFGGSASEALSGVESYERIDAELLDAWHWQELVKGGREEFSVGYGGGSVQISEESILVFGGLNESQYFDYSAIFNVNTGVMVPMGDSLKLKDAFYQRVPLVLDGKVYCVGFLTKSLHVFDVLEKQWSLVPLELKQERISVA